MDPGDLLTWVAVGSIMLFVLEDAFQRKGW